jgi:hypothetical protein
MILNSNMDRVKIQISYLLHVILRKNIFVAINLTLRLNLIGLVTKEILYQQIQDLLLMSQLVQLPAITCILKLQRLK